MPSSRSKLTPRKTTDDLSVLVNADRIRSSIKRLFHNNIAEVVAEALQNSQRACAKNVEISITPDGFSITDDGHGLLDGIDGFHTLLKLAESAFDNPTVEDQDPMGVGIVSLMTHDKVEEITFSSGKLQLTVDAARWWSDKDYYSTWFERVRKVRKAVQGLSIYVWCKAELITELRKALEPKDRKPIFSDSIFDLSSPAQGYEGILNITLDGKPVRTSLPAWTRFDDTLITTTYKGAALTIGYDSGAHTTRSSLRWYGQLILVKTPHNRFKFHLDVTNGRPVNPLSPTRAGLIQDAAYHELLAFVKDEIFSFVLNPANRAKITAAHVEECFSIDALRTTEESPYLTTRAILPIVNPSSIDDCEPVGNNVELFTYDEAPLLLDQTVIVLQNNQTVTTEYGISSFAPLLKNPHTLRHGDSRRLRIGRLWWKPGKKSKAPWFFKPGEFGISFGEGQQPKRWKAVTETPVFTFNDTGSYSVEDVDFTVGTVDPMSFLNDQVWVAYSPSDDSDHEVQEGYFRESVDALIRSLIGKCVPRDFKLWDLREFVKDSSAVKTVTYHYPKGTFARNAPASSPHPIPTAITVHSADKRSVRLKLY